MTDRRAIKIRHFKLAIILTLAIFIVVGFEGSSSPDNAVSMINVTENWTWDDLKTAIETTYKGQEVVFNINRNEVLAATSKITIAGNTTVTLNCTNIAHTTHADISRSKSYHGHLFQVNDGNTLNLNCCLNGNYKDGDGNIRGFFKTGKEEDGHYGNAMVLNHGTVNMNSEKSVIKNNYNAYALDGNWKYNSTTYYGGDFSGGGDYAAYGSAILSINGDFNMHNGQIFGCVADNGPAIFVASGYESDQTKISGGEIYDNAARRYGGAVYVASRQDYGTEASANYIGKRIFDSTGKNALLTINDGSIYNNIAKLNAGGVVVAHGATMYMNGGEIYENIAVTGTGGGVRCNAGDENTLYEDSILCLAKPGGQTWIDGGKIYNNTAATHGGGIISGSNYDQYNLLKISGGEFYGNTAGENGGGICVSGSPASYEFEIDIKSNPVETETPVLDSEGQPVPNGRLIMTGGKVYSNTAGDKGGGVYIAADGPQSTISSCEIYNNTASRGGGIGSMRIAGVNFANGNVYENNAELYGGGLYVENSLFDMTGGKIYTNTAVTNKGNGVYVAGECTFKLSLDGLVNTNNDLYLTGYNYITVPQKFASPQIVRANVTGDNFNLGRIIAKGGNTETDNGSEYLYWYNNNEIDYTNQHFTVNGHIIRSGDQGAAKNNENINNQDIFLSEKYAVNFDMNPSDTETSAITHIIGSEKYVFDNLNTNHVNSGLYIKYWYEELTFNPGNAVTTSETAEFTEWNDAADGSGIIYKADTTATIPFSVNKDVTLYAQWDVAVAVTVDIDYDGNGATDGDNWTEEKIDITEGYDVSDDDTVFTRKETDNKDVRLFKFTGWSLEEKAIARDYDFGAKISASELKSYVRNLDGRKRAVATIYAVWDEFPTIEAVDRWFTLDEAQKGKITLQELMATATATDGTVGDPTDFTKALTGSEEFTVIDFNIEDFKAFTTSGNATVTYKAVDGVGNEAYKTVVIHIVDKDAQKQDEVTRFTRFISPNYFKNENGEFIDHQYGGLKANSKWRTEPEYIALLTSTLSNTKGASTGKWATVTQTWYWSMEEIVQSKSYIATHGVGNAQNPNALKDFYNQFGPDSDN